MRAFKRTKWISDRTGQKLISYEPPETRKTQVVVTTDRLEEIKVIVAESNGIVQEAAVLVDRFASHSRDGSLRVEIRNVGDFKADYIVEVANCNGNIVEAIPAQARTLQPIQEATLYFELYTIGNSATSNACGVTLKSPRGRIYDTLPVFFESAENPAP